MTQGIARAWPCHAVDFLSFQKKVVKKRKKDSRKGIATRQKKTSRDQKLSAGTGGSGKKELKDVE